MKNTFAVSEKILIAMASISLLFWIYNFLAISHNPKILYFFLWPILGGGAVYYFKESIVTWVNSPGINLSARFFIAGYIMVLLEEVLAALVNNLYEGFTMALFLERILQFWAFNILAFSGLFIGWFLLRKYFLYTNKEVFYLTGIFGIYTELLSKGFGDILSIILLSTPMIFVYGLIVIPLAFVRMPGKKRIANKSARFLLPLLIIFVCSLPFIFSLTKLRCAYPNAFPPSEFIPNEACN